MNRRTLLRAAALAPLAAIGPAFGQVGWPDRVLRIVVPFVPGSFTDVSARLLANELTEQLGQPVVIENRGGAGGTAGTVAVVRAAPDAAIRCCLTSRRVAYRRASGMRNKIRSKWTLGVFRAGGLPS